MNPPNPPAYSMSPASDAYAAQHLGPPRWSALAITAFVLSIIGFLGFTAILGIIFAVAGIAVTRGGRRRGMGLAISAIPISLVTGALGALLLVTVVMVWRMGEISNRIEPILSASSAESSKCADEIYAMGSPAFQTAVSKEKIETWLADVKQKHGTLSGFEKQNDLGLITSDPNGAFVLNLRGKFTNGPALVRIIFSSGYFLESHMNDIDVDGISLRTPSNDRKIE